MHGICSAQYLDDESASMQTHTNPAELAEASASHPHPKKALLRYINRIGLSQAAQGQGSCKH